MAYDPPKNILVWWNQETVEHFTAFIKKQGDYVRERMSV
jgi:hypothetical protein